MVNNLIKRLYFPSAIDIDANVSDARKINILQRVFEKEILHLHNLLSQPIFDEDQIRLAHQLLPLKPLKPSNIITNAVPSSPTAAGSGVSAVLRRRNCPVTNQLSFLQSSLHEASVQVSYSFRFFTHQTIIFTLKITKKRTALYEHGRFFSYPHDYKFLRAIGKGGFGTVYLAQRLDSKKLCAIKVHTL